MQRPQSMAVEAPVRATVRSRNPDEVSSVFRRVYGRPVRVRPMGDPDAFRFAADIVRIGPLTVGRFSNDTGWALDRLELESGYSVLSPLTGSARARHRGQDLVADPARTAVLSPIGDVTLDTSGECRLLIVTIDRHTLETELGAASSDPLAPVPLSTGFGTASGPGRTWTALTRLLLTELQRPGGLGDQPAMVRSWRDMVVRGLAVTLDGPAAAPAPVVFRPRTVKRAMDAMHAEPAYPFTAAELAAVAGVGVRVLQESFRRHVGVSPFTYLRRVRLDRVHAELTRAEPGRVSVSEVAHRWGFEHLGRFAGAYRARYGESPSQTVRGSR